MAGERISATKAFALVADILREMPVKWKAGFSAELTAFEPKLLARMRAGVPTRTGPRPSLYARSRPGAMRPPGGLVSLLSTQFDPDRLSVTGGLVTPDAKARGFYGYILDAGRGLKRSRSKMASRKLYRAAGAKGFPYSIKYSRKISPIAPGKYDITFGRVREWARSEIGPILGRVYDRTLASLMWGNS
jgi:hypothetical protein